MHINGKQITRLGLAAGALSLGWVLAGCGGEQPAADPPASTTSGPPPGAMGSMGGGAMPGPGMGGGFGGPGVPGAPGAAGLPAAPAAQVANTPPPPHRADPFKPWWDSTPPPPNINTFVPPVRIAMLNSGTPVARPGVEIREVPQGRVAGILSGNGVYALIESPDAPQGQAVIRPGDMIGEYRVASINPDSVTLKRTVRVGDRTETYTQVVPLTDIGSFAQQQFSPGGAGGPGMPGMAPGGGFGGGLPGMRGGGGKASEVE